MLHILYGIFSIFLVLRLLAQKHWNLFATFLCMVILLQKQFHLLKYIPFMLFYFPVRPRRKPKIQRVSCHFGKSLDTWKGRFPRRRVYSVISYLNLWGKRSFWSCTLNFWTSAIWRYFSIKEKSWNCRSESIWMRLQKVFEPIVSCNLLP